MPFMSAEARGKLANCVVAFVWKGRNVLRQWTIPTNPRDIDQKVQRQIFAAMGKNLAVIETPKTGLLDGSKIYQLAKADAPATQIWNAHFVKEALDDLKVDSAFTAFSASMFGCADTIIEWRCAATELGMATLTGAPYATSISPELQLAMGGYAAYKMALSGATDIYSTHPELWTTDMIKDFQAEYQTTA